MTQRLRYDLVLTSKESDDVAAVRAIEVVCVYGRPTAAGLDWERDIPFTIKEVTLSGRPLGFQEREFVIDLLGGRERLQEIIFQSDIAGHA